MSRRSTVHRRIAVCLGAAALTLGLAVAPTSATAAAASDNLPGVPEPGSEAAVWEAWVADELALAEATDWEAEAAARGCELQDVTVSLEVDADYNREMGAPADLETHRVDLAEKCPETPTPALRSGATASSDQMSAASIPSGNRCGSTSGPGVVCISKSGNQISASWRYDGSGSVKGFLRIYRGASSATSCPTATTWLSGSTQTWSSGVTRSISKTRTQAGTYSARIWREALIGHTNWGTTCAKL